MAGRMKGFSCTMVAWPQRIRVDEGAFRFSAAASRWRLSLEDTRFPVSEGALQATGTLGLEHRPFATLSGGGTVLQATGPVFASHSTNSLRGKVLLMTSGPAAGATSSIGGKNADDTVSLWDPWTVNPGPNDTFVLLSGSSGCPRLSSVTT